MSLISGSYLGALVGIGGAPDIFAALVEKFEEELEVVPARATPKVAERAAAVARGAAVSRALRSCCVAVRRLRLTADMSSEGM